jgi:hypothetical protein
MRGWKWFGLGLAIIAGAAWFMQASGQEKVTEQKPAAAKPEFGYVGSETCMVCHKNPEKGDQYGKWLNSPHAKAYAALCTARATKIAAEKGLKQPAAEAPECIRCHITGWDAKPELLGKSYDKTDGIGCESCHGPAGQYRMIHQKDVAKAMTLGMIEPTEAVCRSCHNEQSPTYKPFDFAKMSATIAHPIPKKAQK